MAEGGSIAGFASYLKNKAQTGADSIASHLEVSGIIAGVFSIEMHFSIGIFSEDVHEKVAADKVINARVDKNRDAAFSPVPIDIG